MIPARVLCGNCRGTGRVGATEHDDRCPSCGGGGIVLDTAAARIEYAIQEHDTPTIHGTFTTSQSTTSQ